ncbi:MAG: hypothetical protein Q7J47_06020 [Azoarcus sp.]|nr:hypothetical protein [Azoarcus sp.]
MDSSRKKGYQMGERHHRSRLTDHEVELVRVLREEGLSFSLLAAKFEVSKSCVVGICHYRRRACTLYAP